MGHSFLVLVVTVLYYPSVLRPFFVGDELYTNLGLAFLAVFVVTLFLVANIWVCILVCFSVILSVVSTRRCIHLPDK